MPYCVGEKNKWNSRNLKVLDEKMHGKKETNKSNIAEKGFEQKKKKKKKKKKENFLYRAAVYTCLWKIRWKCIIINCTKINKEFYISNSKYQWDLIIFLLGCEN